MTKGRRRRRAAARAQEAQGVEIEEQAVPTEAEEQDDPTTPVQAEQWPDLDQAVEPDGVDGEPGAAAELRLASRAQLSIELGVEALRDAVTEYLGARLLPGAIVEGVSFVAGSWRALVSLGPPGTLFTRRSDVGALADGSEPLVVDEEDGSLENLLDERRSRREAAHERMLAKRGTELRLRS